MDWIQGERFMDLVNNIDIFYYHTHDVNTFFKKHVPATDFVLISHNSDGCVTDNPKREEDADSRLMPSNLIMWYSQNIAVKNDRIQSLPIGIENNEWSRQAQKKEKMLLKLQERRDGKKLYINFNIKTNPERAGLYQMFEKEIWVTVVYGRHGYKFDEYIDNVYNHLFVLCPEGNGIDTHRVWETLYMGSIPVMKRNINNQFYADLPICFIDNWREVTRSFLNQEYVRIKTSSWNMEKLTFEYWKNRIQNEIK